MARRSGLGRGLDALIPGSDAVEVPATVTAGLTELAISDVDPNPHQPRSHFDEETLASLAASVRELGVLQPILVRPTGERFELIAGERRWRAARRAGLTTIPAVIRPIDDSTSLEQALVENLHRQDLNPLEEAGAYQQLIEDFGLTQEDVARRVGRSRSAVANILRLFQLPPAIQRMVREKQLQMGHARALLGTPDRAYQEQLARQISKEDLSVRAVAAASCRRGRLRRSVQPPASAPARAARSPAGDRRDAPTPRPCERSSPR